MAAHELDRLALDQLFRRLEAPMVGVVRRWLWNTEDPQGFVVFHLDASRHHAQWECDEKGLPPSEMLENYRRAAAAQARGEPVEAILPLVPQTSGKRVLAESGLCQRFAPPMRAAPADVSTRHDTVTSVTG